MEMMIRVLSGCAPFITIKCTITLSPHACEQVCRCNKPKLGNRIVWSHLERCSVPIHRAGECSAGLPIPLLPLAAPNGYQILISLSQRESRREGRVRTRTRLELNTMESSVRRSQSPFIGIVECFVTE